LSWYTYIILVLTWYFLGAIILAWICLGAHMSSWFYLGIFLVRLFFLEFNLILSCRFILSWFHLASFLAQFTFLGFLDTTNRPELGFGRWPQIRPIEGPKGCLIAHCIDSAAFSYRKFSPGNCWPRFPTFISHFRSLPSHIAMPLCMHTWLCEYAYEGESARGPGAPRNRAAVRDRAWLGNSIRLGTSRPGSMLLPAISLCLCVCTRSGILMPMCQHFLGVVPRNWEACYYRE
jgi:hypothetical protein